VRFRILGPLEVAERDVTRPLGGVKQRAVLAILLVHRGEVLSGERLVEELWGARAPATAAKVLQAYISRLRKAVGGDVLLTRGGGYVLSAAAGEVDLDVFERLAADGRAALAAGDPASAAARLREALGLWRGPPLSDFTYEAFAQGEIARLEQARMAALEERIDADLALGRHDQLVPELELLAREHPLRERLCAQRMLALYRAGRQAEALQAYRDSRQVLVDQLGIEPGRELRELHRAIAGQDQRLDLPGQTQTQTQTVAFRQARRSAAFVGRERELSELTEALHDATGGQGRLCLLTGEPGIGKSRLAEELARHARAQGAEVLVGRCWEAGGAPAFWPWVQSLRSYLRGNDRDGLAGELGPGAAEVAAILPELRELIPGLRPPAAPESEGARFRLFHASAEFLRRASDKRPLVLILDDLHAADTPSLLLVQFLARELGSMHVLLVAAMRDVDPLPAEPLTVMLAEVAREPVTRRVSLTGLAEDEVAEYVRLTAGQIASAELSFALYGETEGNPLFVAETVRLLSLEGLPPRASGTPRFAIPPTIGEVISRRLAHLSPACHQMLVQASVLGREFALDALERVCAEPDARFLACVDEATAARVVAEVPGVRGRLRFSHVLVRDTLYDRLGAARRARLHRRAGEMLEGLYARDPGPHLAELAHHFLEASAAGEPGKAVGYARGAAERAVSALAYEEAVRLYQMALQAHGREEPPDAVIGCELLLALGDAQTRAGDTPAAKEAFLLAADLARRTGPSGGVMARAALGYGGRFVFNVSRDDPRLRPLLEEALADLGDGDSELRAMLLARLAGGPLRDEPSRDRRASLSEQAVGMARRLGDPALLGYVLDARFLAIWAPDTIGERLAIVAEMVQLSEAAGDLERLFQGHAYRTGTLLELGDLAAVQTQIGIAGRISDDLRQPAQLWMVAAGRALCALLEGRFEQAGDLIEEAFRLGERSIPWFAAVTRDLQLFALRREQGRLDELEEAIRGAVRVYPTYPVWRCVLADLYAELGRQDEARAEFERFAAGDFTGLPFNEEWLLGMTLLADVCAALDDVPRAGRLYELLLPYRELHAVGQVEISFGAVARALGKLAATADRFEQATRHFEAAIQLNQQSGARPWTAHARHDYARMLAARGDRQQAHQQLARALATYRELGMDRWADNTLARDGSTLPTGAR
jgi:DNA-binding SARP family transcriptional activator